MRAKNVGCPLTLTVALTTGQHYLLLVMKSDIFSVAEFRIPEYLAVSLPSGNLTSKGQMDILTIITVGAVKTTICITGTYYSKVKLFMLQSV